MTILLQFTKMLKNAATVNLKALFKTCAKIACCLLFLYAGSSIQNAGQLIVSCTHLYFKILFLTF